MSLNLIYFEVSEDLIFFFFFLMVPDTKNSRYCFWSFLNMYINIYKYISCCGSIFIFWPFTGETLF